MNHPITYTCVGCSKPHNTQVGKTPSGWQWVDGDLRCDDCSPAQANAPVDGSKPASIRSETSIRLLSGGYLDLADPDCSVIQAIDIAAGLRQPRFSAQTRDFYTIAQHSLLVLDLVEPHAKAVGGEKAIQLRRCALMHDATEAFIHDITRPLKIQLPDYRAIEARLDLRMRARFGWDWTDWRRDIVKRADIEALAIEQRDLKGVEHAWPIFDQVDRAALSETTITRCWHVDEAQDRFLTAFADLFPTEERIAA